ncbi:putative cell cycle-associated protein-like protein [Dinothrombium tinctorium]|uniref:Putative cell cycle-associated protein-like protein n=1 Tax=Dinothrombium tinctorium TaxID=1965070 RepID=A0A3S3NT23_9ACAR|nr:putative cell cycle-associated protein-like protein [Dinothrombium tinctorium]
MSYPTKEDRERCWNAKDNYWRCLDSHDSKACQETRRMFESSCPPLWERMEKEGFDPVEEKKKEGS